MISLCHFLCDLDLLCLLIKSTTLCSVNSFLKVCFPCFSVSHHLSRFHRCLGSEELKNSSPNTNCHFYKDSIMSSIYITLDNFRTFTPVLHFCWSRNFEIIEVYTIFFLLFGITQQHLRISYTTLFCFILTFLGMYCERIFL